LITAIINQELVPKIREAKVRGKCLSANGKSKFYKSFIRQFGFSFLYICRPTEEISLLSAESMKIKSFLAKPFASYIYKGIRKGMGTAVSDQENILKTLIKVGRTTEFGKQVGLDKVNNYTDFKQAVSISDYEEMKPYINLIKEGKHNVLWKGKPIYLAKTSGTTSGTK
jgi:hypothetical protein